MRAVVTPLVSELRVFAAGRGYGEPYDAACSVVWHGDEAEIRGLDVALSKEAIRAIDRALKEAGASARWYERRDDGGKVRLVRRKRL
jgi:hypothetical protein